MAPTLDNVESDTDVSDDAHEAEEVEVPCSLTCRRVVAETLRYQIDRPHRSVYPGSFLHDVLHALDPAADRSCAAPQLSVEANSAWTC